MIAQYTAKNHRRWDNQLLSLQFAYNTARHDAIGYTSAYLNHDRELAYPHPEDWRHESNQTPHITRRRLEEAHQLVCISLARAFQKQEAYYNLRRRDWCPRIGDKVWKREYPLSKKRPRVSMLNSHHGTRDHWKYGKLFLR